MTLKTQSQKVNLYFEIQEGSKKDKNTIDKIQVNNPFDVKQAVEKYKARLQELINAPEPWNLHLSLNFMPSGRSLPWHYSLESYRDGKRVDADYTNKCLNDACRLLSSNKENVRRELWRIFNAWRDLPFYANYDKLEEPDFTKWPTKEDYDKYSPVLNKPVPGFLENFFKPEPNHPLRILLQAS